MPVEIRDLVAGQDGDTYISNFNLNFDDLAQLANNNELELETIKASVNPGTLNDLRQALTNYVDNGGFWIWQRGVGPFTTNGKYTADRWKINTAGLSVSRTTGHQGDFGLAINGAGQVIQELPKEFVGALRGVFVKAGVWVKTTVEENARIGIFDGNSTTFGNSVLGTGNFEFIVTGQSFATPPSQVRLILENRKNTSTVWSGATLVRGNPNALVYVPRLPSVDWQECECYYETGKIHYAGIGRKVGDDREAEIEVQFSTYKCAVPDVTFDEETGEFTFQTFSKSQNGFGLRIRHIGGGSSTDGFVVRDVLWNAEVP